MSKQTLFQRVLWALPAGAILCVAWALPFLRWPLDADFIANPDALVRLERIRQWLEGGGWYAPVLLRVSGPEGQVLHWSRPLDVLVSLGAWPLSFYMDMQAAVLMAAMGASFIAYVLTASLMFWCVSECFKAPLWVAGLTSISLVSLSDVVTMYIGSGWPDHHGLMTLLFVLTLGLSIRIAAGEAHKWDFLSFGLAQALAVWISPESFVPMVALYGGLVLVWLVEGCDERAKTSLLSSLVLVLGVALALCLEYGLTWPGFVLDRLSLFSLLLAGVMSAVWAGIWFCPKPLNRSILLRCVWVLGLSLVGSVTIIVLVPHVLSGPMAEADVWFVTTWSEVFGDGFRRVIWDGWVLVVLALACLLVLYKRKPTLCLALAPILLMSGVLSEVDSPRWIVYGKIVAIMVMVYGFSFLWPRLTALGDGIAAILARACSLSFVLLAPLILTYILTLWDGPSLMAGPVQTPSASQPCSVQSLLPFLEAQPHTRLLTHANVSPAFLYFSKHDVMAVPIHPNAKAVHDSVRILIGNNDATALGLLKKYGIGLIIMCATGHENIAYGSTHDGLYARALRGQGPKWLQPLETPQSAFRVFAVQN